MVRHHVKGKKKSSPASQKTKKAEEKKQKDLLKDLDRFAGSSEEEEGPYNDTDDESLDDASSNNVKNMKETGGDDADEAGDNVSSPHDDNGGEDDDDDDDDDDSSDEDEYGAAPTMKQTIKKFKNAEDTDSDEDESSDNEIIDDNQMQTGMSGAMARILGFKAPTSTKQKSNETKSVVLSKTFTPLQKQQKKEKEEQDAMKLKRKQRREVNLTALHVPLSAATSRPIMGKGHDSDAIAKAMANEIEVESMHRRVATRGVVALFNTIAQHQQQKAQQQVEASLTSKKNEEVKTMSKHGFLDMLKKTGSSKAEAAKEKSMVAKKSDSGGSEKKASKGWNALKDDFMMGSKLKDWDKALSDDEDSDDDDNDAGGMKRAADGDDVMDDDWSSEDEKPKKRKVAA